MPLVERTSFDSLGAGFTSSQQRSPSGERKLITSVSRTIQVEKPKEIDFAKAFREERIQEKAVCDYICKNVLNNN